MKYQLPVSLVLLCSIAAMISSCGVSEVANAPISTVRAKEPEAFGATRNEIQEPPAPLEDRISIVDNGQNIPDELKRVIELAWSDSVSDQEELKRMGWHVARDCFPGHYAEPKEAEMARPRKPSD